MRRGRKRRPLPDLDPATQASLLRLGARDPMFYGHALARLVRESGAGARRRLGDAIRVVGHLAALVDAHDFRRRGWVLAADERGEALSSVERLRTGARVKLNFGDGQAAAAIQQVSKHGKEAG